MTREIIQEKSKNYQRIASAITFIAEHQREQPGLDELSAHLHLSPFHLQRLFSEWAGVSPKQFLLFLNKENAVRRLRENSIAETSYASGLSGPGRLHDLMIKCYGMTPGEYARLGECLDIYYAFHQSPFGNCFIASTDKGICKLAFFNHIQEKNLLLDELKREWPAANFIADAAKIEKISEHIFATPSSKPRSKKTKSLSILLKGSAFQLQVWEALLRIPFGELKTYGDVAELVGKAQATRAVSSAIAKNPVGWLIPCHRVIRRNGDFNQYRWDPIRKQAMIGWEASQKLLLS